MAYKVRLCDVLDMICVINDMICLINDVQETALHLAATVLPIQPQNKQESRFTSKCELPLWLAVGCEL